MDFRRLLCQIAVKHGTEDRASHGQHVLGREEEGDGGMRHMHPRSPLRVQKKSSSSLVHTSALAHTNTDMTELYAAQPRSSLKEIFTLCAGTFCDPPKGPTMKWTSAISSLLNIKAFLKEEQFPQISLWCCITSKPPTHQFPADAGYFSRFTQDAGARKPHQGFLHFDCIMAINCD